MVDHRCGAWRCHRAGLMARPAQVAHWCDAGVLPQLDPVHHHRVRWLLFAAFPIAYLAFVFLAFFLQSALYGWLTPSVTRNADAVVVLGAGLRNGEVTPLLATRLDRGKQVFDRLRNPEAVLIASGGQGADEPHPEAQAMAAYLREAGADPERLWQENQSRTTEENLTLSTELLDQRGRSNPRCIVVTNNYHVFRAALLMRKLGLRGHAVGAPTAPYYCPSAFLREYVAILRDHKYVTAVALILACIPLIFTVVSQILSLFT